MVFGAVMPHREQTISTLPSSNKVTGIAAIPAACSGTLANTSGKRVASPSRTKAAGNAAFTAYVFMKPSPQRYIGRSYGRQQKNAMM
jgi:hypothetical protein